MIELDFIDNNTSKVVCSLPVKVMHFRQFEGKHPSQYGGHTVMIFNNGSIVTVAKCNNKDRFSRRKGVITCIHKYLERFPISNDFPKGTDLLSFSSAEGLFQVRIGTMLVEDRLWWCK